MTFRKLQIALACAGAAQGIGRCFAHALGEAGAQIAVADVNGDAAQAAAEELRAKGIRAIAIQVRAANGSALLRLFTMCFAHCSALLWARGMCAHVTRMRALHRAGNTR